MNALLEGNFAEAYCKWKPLAQRGYAEAQYNLGWLYANGNGLNVDLQLAHHWWAAAARQGHADAPAIGTRTKLDVFAPNLVELQHGRP